ncbi:MAG: MBL fold metallo-hydrolase [Acidimicrobiales bacterium]
MFLSFLGCRGSTPVSDPECARYGGATSCVAVWPGAADDPWPHLVLDAGTGFVNLEHVLGDAPFVGTVLLTHLHWDHTHGLPFLRQAGMPGHRLRLVVPGQGADPEEVMNRAFSPPHFPVPIAMLGANWSFDGIEPGTYDVEGFEVRAAEIPHKGSRTFGYRVDDGESSFAYLPDHMPLGAGTGPEGLGEYHQAALALAAGVDLLVHDAQHTASELEEKAFLGHSAAEYVVGLGVAAGARAVALFHHDPHRTDAQLDELVDALGSRAPLPVLAAHEGMVLALGAAAGAGAGAGGSRGLSVGGTAGGQGRVPAPVPREVGDAKWGPPRATEEGPPGPGA